ncbi:MAG: hypothetical protein IH933_03725 [Euryarchaeota archaeon]|nr:hypothetical protein [Euryarchaeota archaeon]
MATDIIVGGEVWVFFEVNVLDAASATARGIFPLTIDDPSGEVVIGREPRTFITAEEDPVLAKVWDNDVDEIFDTL